MTEIELIFFIVATMGLCFGFVTKTVLVTQGYFNYCWTVLAQHQGLLCFSPHPTSKQAGDAQEAARGHSQLTPTDQRDTPRRMASCWAISTMGKKEEGEMFGAMASVFPSNCDTWWSPAFLEMAEQLPAGGKWWMNSLFRFACVAFALPIKLCLSQPMSSHTFTLPIHSPIPPSVSERVAVWGWAASQG